MRYPLRLIHRCVTVVLPCWMMAAPVATLAQNEAACRHQAMHQGMHRGTPSGAPCWCGDMTGNTSLLASDAPALPANLAIVLVGAGPLTRSAALPSDGPPASPSYAPIPPPPNGFPA